MKKLNLLFALIFSLILISCGDNTDPLDDLTTGAYPKKLDFSASFKMSDLDNSKATIVVEFEDGDKGNKVDHYDWAVEHRDISSGGTVSNSATLKVFTTSDFTTNADGYQQVDIEFTMQDVLTALNITEQDIEVNDSFRFFAELHMKDGVSYDFNNSQNLITQFDTMFFFEEFIRP